MIEVNIKKDFGSFQLNVEFQAGNEVLALLGGSGSGKSMTLRAIAGIIKPDEGRIVVDGTVFFDSEQKINLPPQKRQVGLLFQNYALFPTMTVLQNIMTGVRSGTRAERRRSALEAAQRFHLPDAIVNNLPSQLSGGQQQRAALARILVGRPKILMLDEPFSALDTYLKDQMEREVLKVIHTFGGTTLFVSHNRDEVYRFADQVAIYHRGHLDAFEHKHTLFQAPRTYISALLTGCKNFSAISERRSDGKTTRIHAADWDMDFILPGEATGEFIAIRGHNLKAVSSPGENVYPMEPVELIEDTFEYVLQIRRKGTNAKPILWMLAKEQYHAMPLENLMVKFPLEALMLLKK